MKIVDVGHARPEVDAVGGKAPVKRVVVLRLVTRVFWKLFARHPDADKRRRALRDRERLLECYRDALCAVSENRTRLVSHLVCGVVRIGPGRDFFRVGNIVVVRVCVQRIGADIFFISIFETVAICVRIVWIGAKSQMVPESASGFDVDVRIVGTWQRATIVGKEEPTAVAVMDADDRPDGNAAFRNLLVIYVERVVDSAGKYDLERCASGRLRPESASAAL